MGSHEEARAFWQVWIRRRLAPEIKILGSLKKAGRGAGLEHYSLEATLNKPAGKKWDENSWVSDKGKILELLLRK